MGRIIDDHFSQVRPKELKEMTPEEQEEYIKKVLAYDKQVTDYVNRTRASVVKTMDNIAKTQMDVEDTQDDAAANKAKIDRELNALLQQNQYTKGDLYHKYKFQVPNIKGYEFEAENQGRNKDCVLDCPCENCKKISKLYKQKT
jgi:hypothetical protein